MAGFTAYVLVSGSTRDVEQRVRYLMAPYHNEFDVEEYETECDCNRKREDYDPDCENCGGTGRYLTTFNQKCIHDGYIMRDFENVLRNAAKDASDWKDDDITDADGAAMASLESLDIERLKLPYVIVTPSGDLHELPGDWWFEEPDSANSKAWRRFVHRLYAKWPSAILVVLSCHQ